MAEINGDRVFPADRVLGMGIIGEEQTLEEGVPRKGVKSCLSGRSVLLSEMQLTPWKRPKSDL